MSDNLLNYTLTCHIKPGFKSDHSIIELNLDFIKQPKGPGYFKLNNSLLLESDYQNKIRKSIDEIAEINKEANPCTLWEIIKGTIRNETIKYSTNKKKTQNETEQKLINTIETIEKQIEKSTTDILTETLTLELDNNRKLLNDIIETKLNGIIIRSKAQFVEHNEKNTAYFSNLEKKKSEKKCIKTLKHNGKFITNIDDIMKLQCFFYTELYKKRELKQSNYNFFNNTMQVLNNEQKTNCEGMLNEFECASSLKAMKNNKSPGSDGITTEFYKIFW